MLMLHWHNPELTAWSRVLLESLIFAQLVKKPVTFYCIWMLVLFVRSCAWSLYWARGVQTIPSHPFYLNHFNIGLPQENCHDDAQSAEWLSCLDHYDTTVWCSKCQILPVVDSQFCFSSSPLLYLLLLLLLLFICLLFLLLLFMSSPPPPPLSKRDKHFLVALLQPSLSCAACLQLIIPISFMSLIPIFYMSFSTSFFHLALGLLLGHWW